MICIYEIILGEVNEKRFKRETCGSIWIKSKKDIYFFKSFAFILCIGSLFYFSSILMLKKSSSNLIGYFKHVFYLLNRICIVLSYVNCELLGSMDKDITHLINYFYILI